MTSEGKQESNKRNALRSTGPRTAGGKLRSRHNARRHGLAAPIQDDPEVKGRIDSLAEILADGSNEFERIEQSRILAECHFELSRIRAARYQVFLTMDGLENMGSNDFEKALHAMGKISRYETRAFSKCRRALRESNG